jgi:uncharacterized membrane protein
MKRHLLPIALVGAALALIAALVLLPRLQKQTFLSGYVEGDALYLASPVSGALSDAELEALFDLGYHFKHVDTIFARVFGDGV